MTSVTHSFYIEALKSVPTYSNDENSMRFIAPKGSGLYLVGNAVFNPHTDEQIFFIKVGKSKDIKSRMKNYLSSNPMLFHIDYCLAEYKEMHDLERQCHLMLFEKCQAVMEGTMEWVKVDKTLYLEICQKGFNFFFENA